MLHRLAHWLHWQRGVVVAATGDHRLVWIGFRCVTCGVITGKHIAYYCAPQPPPDNAFS